MHFYNFFQFFQFFQYRHIRVCTVISRIGIAVRMRIDSKNNLVPSKKLAPFRTRISKKSMGWFFLCTLQIFFHWNWWDIIIKVFCLWSYKFQRKILHNVVIVHVRKKIITIKITHPLTFYIFWYARVLFFSQGARLFFKSIHIHVAILIRLMNLKLSLVSCFMYILTQRE